MMEKSVLKEIYKGIGLQPKDLEKVLAMHDLVNLPKQKNLVTEGQLS